MYIKAEKIEQLPAGTKLLIEGRTYYRMADAPEDHMVGFLFDPEDGTWGSWSRIALYDSEVEIFT